VHPASSVILFTTASGAGYGLLFLFGVFAALGMLPDDAWLGFTGLALALALITVGLLASTFHLGHPERAWRAFSQWRSSWLSREGVAAVVTYPPAGLFGIGWILLGENGGIWAAFGLLAAAAAVATVYCTGMIYASLKPIRAWRNRWTVPCYLALSLMTGALLLNPLSIGFGAWHWSFALLALAATGLAWALKAAYWSHIARDTGGSTAESATGLGRFGRVRLLESPNTEENYLLKEMGFRIARRHADKLRRIAHVAGFGIPCLGLLALLALGPGVVGMLAALAVALSAAVGVATERWLFFAEAKHTVTLYYGAATA